VAAAQSSSTVTPPKLAQNMDSAKLREEYEHVQAEIHDLEGELCRQHQALLVAQRSLRQAELDRGEGLFGVIKRLIDPEHARQLDDQVRTQAAVVGEVEASIAVMDIAAACLRVRQENLIDEILHSIPREFQTFLPREYAWRLARGKCERCGRDSTQARMRFHIHHIKPRAQGGDDSLANALLLCEKCHGQQVYSRKTGQAERGSRDAREPRGRL
jgi:hypothetical protein